MASKAVVSGDAVVCVYDDRFRSLLEAIGPLHVERATEVEYEPISGDWVARHLASGQAVGRGKNRADVISQEVAWLEREIVK